MCSRVWSVEDGGEGWVMSQAHMFASVPDLLVSPVRHVTQQGAARAPVCCARKQDNENMLEMQITPTMWMRGESPSRTRHSHCLHAHTECTVAALCLLLSVSVMGGFLGWREKLPSTPPFNGRGKQTRKLNIKHRCTKKWKKGGEQQQERKQRTRRVEWMGGK